MQDLENRLRELGERAIREVPSELRPTSRALRRIRVGRAVRSGAVLAAVAALVIGGFAAGRSLSMNDALPPAEEQPKPTLGPATNGWVAVDAYQDGGGIYLVRPGEDARRLKVAGPGATSDACPAWSPDGTRLLFGRLTGSPGTGSKDAELVIVPVGSDGAIGAPTRIGLDRFEVLEGFDAHPCGTWAPDGRWVAFAGTGEVWVVDTQTGEIRHLPDLRPSDLEWRPGTDKLTIAGDMGADRGAPTLSTPVTVYSVSTGELSHLGSVEAAHITWSPDGTSLAYTGGENETRELGLVDGDGTNERLLVADLWEAIHGIGPVWSPAGDRIAYQRCLGGPNVDCSGENHEVVLVSVADGTETVIEPPKADGHEWYPFSVSWSPDGTTLLYAAWQNSESLPGGVIAVPAEMPSDATVLIDSIDPVPNVYSHLWAPIQMWGRQPG
jgi:Tol biopolymer transport system component